MRSFGCFMLAAGALFAQNPAPPHIEERIEIRVAGPGHGGPPGDVLFFRQGVPGLPPGATVEFIGPEMMGPGGPVKGAPYAAEITSESMQTLGDGNRITQKNVSNFYRDSEGRTRREVQVQAREKVGAHTLVFINDPVAGVHYVLNSLERTARKMELPRLAASDRLMPAPGLGPLPIGQPLPGSAPAVEQLGKQMMEGVEVTGTRTTVTIPAGQIGNERPLVSSTETWTSAQVTAVVLTKSSDPRSGSRTTRATMIRRGEQPRYLFEVPADYKVEEMKPGVRRIERKL